MMKIRNGGITMNIFDCDWDAYKKAGYVLAVEETKPEPQPVKVEESAEPEEKPKEPKAKK